MYAEGDLVLTKSASRLIYEDKKKDFGMNEIPLKLGTVGIVLKDNSCDLPSSGETLVFLYVFIQGRCGWIMDDCVEEL